MSARDSAAIWYRHNRKMLHTCLPAEGSLPCVAASSTSPARTHDQSSSPTVPGSSPQVNSPCDGYAHCGECRLQWKLRKPFGGECTRCSAQVGMGSLPPRAMPPTTPTSPRTLTPPRPAVMDASPGLRDDFYGWQGRMTQYTYIYIHKKGDRSIYTPLFESRS